MCGVLKCDLPRRAPPPPQDNAPEWDTWIWIPEDALAGWYRGGSTRAHVTEDARRKLTEWQVEVTGKELPTSCCIIQKDKAYVYLDADYCMDWDKN